MKTTTEIKNLLDGLSGRVEMAKDRNNELRDISIHIHSF